MDADLTADPSDEVTATALPAISTPSDLDSVWPSVVNTAKSDVIDNDENQNELQDELSTSVSPIASVRLPPVVPAASVVDRLVFSATAVTWDATAMAPINAIASSILRPLPSKLEPVVGCATERTSPSPSNSEQLRHLLAPSRDQQRRKHQKPLSAGGIFDDYQPDQTPTEATTVNDHQPEISDEGIIGNDGATGGTSGLLRVEREGTSISVDEKSTDSSITPQARNEPAAAKTDSCSDFENNLLTSRDLSTNVDREQTTNAALSVISGQQKSTDVNTTVPFDEIFT